MNGPSTESIHDAPALSSVYGGLARETHGDRRVIASAAPTTDRRITVLYVDDNEGVASALKTMFDREPDLAWLGWLPDALDLTAQVARTRPQILLLDVDMPGRDTFEAAAEVAGLFPESRIIFFSGHVRADLVDRALESGAWGYISKSDGEDALLDAVRRVMLGEFVLSPEVRTVYDLR
jgi:DNA-binding NarL/FixJ family response regulator